jgi:hypothetical protein
MQKFLEKTMLQRFYQAKIRSTLGLSASFSGHYFFEPMRLRTGLKIVRQARVDPLRG